MMNDIDIDIEELESRLYSQVYHSSADNYEEGNAVPNICEATTTVRQNLRYFRVEGRQELNYIPLPNDIAKTKARAADFFQVSSDNIINAVQQIPVNNNQIQQSVIHMVNPCNNILVLPPTPTQVVSNSDLLNPGVMNVENYLDKQTRRQRKRQRWLDRIRQRRKEKKIFSKQAKIDNSNNSNTNETNKDNFKVHYLNEKASLTPNQQDSIVTICDSIVTISDSESNDSCVELLEGKEELIVVSSGESDTEDKNVNQITDRVKEVATGDIESVEINDDSQIEEIKTEDKSEKGLANPPTQEQDDDVLFIDDIPELEVIEIDCDTKSVTNVEESKVSSESTSISSSTKQPESRVKQKTLSAIKERNELLKTPDSTSTSNDFLDNSVDLQQKRFNFGLHGSDFNDTETFTKPQSQTDLFETESSCSASENNTPIKSNVFKEVEFESPSKDLFTEENLESFGNYITPNRNNVSESTSSPRKEFDQVLTKASAKSARKLTSECSDSSSESDYEVIEETPTKKAKKIKQLPILTCVETRNLLQEQETPLENGTNLNENGTNKRKMTMSSEEDVMPEKKAKDNSLLSTSISTLDSEMECMANNENIQNSEINKETTGQEILKDPNKSDLSNNASEIFSNGENDLEQVEEVITDIQLGNFSSAESKQQENMEKIETAKSILQVDEQIKNYSFSNYWTNDMHKFYNTSWGLENFSVKEIQKTMSTDPKLWKISDEDRYHYRIHTHKRLRCNNCRESGHIAINCMNGKRPIVCTLCGQMGHIEVRCPNAICTLCGARGGYGTYCSKCAKWRYMRCQVCHMYGHINEKCPDLWRRYHLTIEPGPIVKPLKTVHKNIEDRWCSGCAKRGHYEYSCRFHTRSHHSVDPYIKEYYDLYNFQKNQPFVIRCDYPSNNTTNAPNPETEKPKGQTENANSIPRDEAKPSTSKHNTDTAKSKLQNETATNKISHSPEKHVDINKEDKTNDADGGRKSETSIQVTFDNFVFPPKEMIPAYFLKQMGIFENNSTTDVRSPERTPSKDQHSNDGRNTRAPDPPQPEFKTPTNLSVSSNNARKSCTIQLNYKLYGFIHSKRGVKLVNQFQNIPDISLTVTKGCDEPYPSGKITICGRGKDVRDIQQQLLKLFRSVPQIDVLPKFSKPFSNLLLSKFSKVERMVGNCKVIYKNLMKLQAQLKLSKEDVEIKRKIRSTKVCLNMLLFGKLELADGKIHMSHLHHWQKEFEKKENHKIPLNILFDILESYAYVFMDTIKHHYQRFCIVQEDTKPKMDKVPTHKDLKLYTHYFKLVEAKCRKFNLHNKLEELNHFKTVLHESNFSVKAFKEFMTFCNKFLHSVKTQNL